MNDAEKFREEQRKSYEEWTLKYTPMSNSRSNNSNISNNKKQEKRYSARKGSAYNASAKKKKSRGRIGKMAVIASLAAAIVAGGLKVTGVIGPKEENTITQMQEKRL